MPEDDMKEKAMGSVLRRDFSGGPYQPCVEELHVRKKDDVVVIFCTKCRNQMAIDLRYAKLLTETSGLPQQTRESLAGKYLQSKACLHCGSGDEDSRVKILNIPQQDKHIPSSENMRPRKDEYSAVCFCVNCGSSDEVTWEFLDDNLPDYIYPMGLRTKESLAGKYFERSSCEHCSGSSFPVEMRVFDIPKE